MILGNFLAIDRETVRDVYNHGENGRWYRRTGGPGGLAGGVHEDSTCNSGSSNCGWVSDRYVASAQEESSSGCSVNTGARPKPFAIVKLIGSLFAIGEHLGDKLYKATH